MGRLSLPRQADTLEPTTVTKLARRIDDAKGGSHEKGRRVQDAGRSDPGGLALSARPKLREGANDRDGTWLFSCEGDVPGQICRGIRRSRPRRIGIRQSELWRERWRAAPGNRPLGAGP